MNIFRSIQNEVARAAGRIAEVLRTGRPMPARIPLPARAPHLTYSHRRRQRLEWMSYVCNRRF